MAENIVGRSFARDAFVQAFSAQAFVQAMLDFERALAGFDMVLRGPRATPIGV